MLTYKKDFNELSTFREVRQFLRNKGKNHNNYYHYTTYDNVKKILLGKKFILTRGNLGSMNDQHKCKVFGEKEDWDKTYLTCFAFGDSENMAMWGLYCLPWEDAVRLCIPKKAMELWLEKIETVYGAILENYELKKGEIMFHDSIVLADIAYIDKNAKENRSKLYWNNNMLDLEHSDNLKGVYANRKMVGYLKNAAWKYENEVRLMIKLKASSERERIVVDIPQEVIDQITLTTGPYFKGEIEERIFKDGIKELNRIEVMNSKFKGLLNYRTLCTTCKNDYDKK